MGWLFAILLMLVAGAVSIVLVQVWQQKLILQTKLQACDLKVEKLGEEAAAKAAMQAERDKLAASYASLRAKAQAIAAADAEKAKAIAEQANTIRADAGAKAALQADRDELAAAFATLRERMQGVIDADAEKAKVIAETKRLSEQFNDRMASEQSQFADRKQRMEAELLTLEKELAPLRAEHSALSEESALTEMGFYKPRFGFATSVRYEQAIDQNYQKQKAMLKAKSAATCSKEWTIDGSVEKGRKHTEKYLSLLVRAFNGECDSAIAKVKATNYQTMENRINKAFESLNKLGEMQYCLIATQYRDLRLDELRLEYEHALKVQAEREEQRAIKEEMRQQAIAERELERAQQEAEREERQFETALAKARAEFESASAAKQAEMQAKLAELEQMVAEAHANKERAISRAQQTKSGHVYVISNLGSFGTNIFKIGMTRRLDPMDRIWELSDASVPFDFDVHAIIYTEDAPGLETELHQRFASRRLNVVNERKEFFHVTIDEIATVVRERCGDIELTLVAEAAEYLQSEAFHRENGSATVSARRFGITDSQPA
jgi:hypothetical protein